METPSKGNTSVSAVAESVVYALHVVPSNHCAFACATENLTTMMDDLGGLVQKESMEKFREGKLEEASSLVQDTWKMVMMKFLPRICKTWGKKLETFLLSEHPECTVEMEAMVCAYVELHGESRWYPEHLEDERKREAGEKIDRRGKRTGDEESKKRIEAPQVFAKYMKLVQERRSGSMDWEKAILEAAKAGKSTTNTVGPDAENYENGKQKKRKREQGKEAEPVIPARFKFTAEGNMIPFEEV